MVPCHLCGRDAGGGWIHGFVPSPDRLKVGLCLEHDSPDHRRVVKAVWQRLMEREIATLNTCNAHHAGPPRLRRLHVTFVEGGSVTTDCLSCETPDSTTLRVLLPDGTLRFHPLSRIRTWEIAFPPYDDANARAEAPPIQKVADHTSPDHTSPDQTAPGQTAMDGHTSANATSPSGT